MNFRKPFVRFIATIALAGSSTAYAQETAYAQDLYFGGNFAFVTYDESGIGDASLNAISGRVGARFDENFSGEIRVGFGIGDDSVDVFGTNVDLSLKNFIGVYGRAGMPVTPSIFPYVVLGYTRGKAEADIEGFGSTSESESDVSFGIGADFDVDIAEDMKINIEYMNYLDKGGTEIDGFSIGVVKAF